MMLLIEDLQKEIEMLRKERHEQIFNICCTEDEKIFYSRYYDTRIFETKQIIKLIKNIYPELYKINGERF